MRKIKTRLTVVALLVVLVPCAALQADAPQAQRQFERAYFLETHEGDLQAAAEAYSAVADDRSAPAALAAEAKKRRQSCIEDLRSEDLAVLMPPETIAYVEIRRPGRHFENLATMLGLVGDPLANLTAGKRAAGIPIPDAPGIEVPGEVFLSPAILSELNRFRGVAAAFTGIAPPPAGNPDLGGVQGILVVHPGEDAALRGLIETAAQFVRPVEPIGGFATINVYPGIVVTFTERLVIAGTSRDLVSGAVGRLVSDKAESLADRQDMKVLADRRRDALLFGFVDAKRAVATAYQNLGNEPDVMHGLGIAQGLLDLGHWQSLSVSIGSSAEGFFGELALALDEGHANLIYNLIRTPPMSGRSLRAVPAGSAAVLGIGINPASSDKTAPLATKADTLRYVTGLDLGRELFANIEEIAVFCLPGERRAGPPLPDVGLVIAAADPAKSQQLWSQLLSIPSIVMGMDVSEPTTKNIAGHEVQVYPMPEGISVYVGQLDHSVVVGLTEQAVAAVVDTVRSGKSILTDDGVRGATDQITADTSILLLAHAGRCMQVAAQFCPPNELPHVQMAGAVLGSTLVTLVADESPTRLRIASELTGLPKVKDIIQMASKFMAGGAGHHHATRHASVVVEEHAGPDGP
jgi:hypothetical protein